MNYKSEFKLLWNWFLVEGEKLDAAHTPLMEFDDYLNYAWRPHMREYYRRLAELKEKYGFSSDSTKRAPVSWEWPEDQLEDTSKGYHSELRKLMRLYYIAVDELDSEHIPMPGQDDYLMYARQPLDHAYHRRLALLKEKYGHD